MRKPNLRGPNRRGPNLRGLAFLAALVARAARIGPPRPVSTAQRLANIPLRGAPLREPVTIHWDAHQVPSIEAANEPDLAVGLGIVHAHLRLAQLEAMRRLATGRISELVGRAGIELDRTLRLMDFTGAVPAIAAMLPPATRQWAEGFVAGINHVVAHAPGRPHEFELLDITAEPWTLEDLLAVTRLAAADVSWMVFARLLRARARLRGQEWDALWPAMQGGDTLPWPERSSEAALGLVRGSNSAAVSAACSGTGAGMIASDPHLSVALPPLWLVAGLHAPGLDVVGLMIPGIPAVALGRSRTLAWGGTSLHAASSELIDVSAEPMTERRETIRVRDGDPVEVRLRQTRFGPVVSDGILLSSARPLALRWVGQRPSDELTALLGVMHAESLEAFREALAGFAVPGQTMLAVEAGAWGRAGRVIAAHLPRRADAPMADLVCAPDQAWGLDDLVPGSAFPATEEAIAVSANDRPTPAPIPVGFFFSPPDRVQRLRELLENDVPVGAETMRAVQLDVVQVRALALRDALLARCPPPSPHTAQALRTLAEWDGSYDAGSAGALVFESLAAALARRAVSPKRLDLLSAIWSGRALLAQRIADAPQPAMRAALREAARVLRRYRSWGAAHRLSLRHPLAALPLVGRRYAVRDFAASGGNDTLNKTGHGLVAGRHRVTFGACARHVSDLSEPDSNLFVLLGGQDGWLGSANASDQMALWRDGRAIAVPLRAETARAWPYRTPLTP